MASNLSQQCHSDLDLELRLYSMSTAAVNNRQVCQYKGKSGHNMGKESGFACITCCMV